MKPNKGKSTLVKGGVSNRVSPADISVLGEIAFDAMMMFDSQRRLTYWNGAAERLYGWTSGEVLGKTAEEFFWFTGTPQEEAEEKDIQRKVDTGEIVRAEYRACRKDGSFFFAECTCQAVFGEAGVITGYAAIHRNRSEQKPMEEGLVHTTKLPADNPNPVMRFSPDGNVVYANAASQPLLESWRQQGQTIPDHLNKAIRDVFETRRNRVVDIEHNNITLACMLAPASDADYVNLYGNDISARKEAERELRSQMEDMNSLLGLLPVGVWIGNEDCSVITGNPAAYRIMGFDPGINASVTNPEPQTPSGLRIFVEGKEVSPEDAPMQVVARTGKPLNNLEHEILFADGTRKTVLTNIVPLFDKHGKVRKVIGAYADITERKWNAESLAQVQQVTAAFSEAVTPLQVARIMIEQGVPTLNATTGSVFLLLEDELTLENIYSSSSESVTRSYQRFPLSLETPVTHALRLDTPIWIRSQQEYKERYPNLAEQINLWGLEAAVAIPLKVNDQKLGALTLSFDQVQKFTENDRNFILNLAQQGAQAMERAQLYQKVRQALSELQATYDQSPIGMIQLDRDLRYIRVNETLAGMNGIPVADHIGKKISEIVPDLTPKLEAGLHRVMETGQPEYDIEIVGETKAEPGVAHTWLEVWYPFRDENGSVMGVNIAVQDITERKRDDRALAEYARQQTAFYQLADRLNRTSSLAEVFEAALEAVIYALQCDRGSILLFDEGGVMRFVAWRGLSETYRKATDGHSPWKPDEKNAELIYYNDIRTADLSESLKTIIQGEGIGSLAFIPLIFEEKLIGKFTVYFNTPHTFSENDLDLSLVIAHQIAFGIQRKGAEEALRESQERFTQFMQHLPGLAWIKDVQGHYVYANDAAEKAFNTPREELYGRSDEDIFPAEVSSQFKKNDELALTENRGIQVIETLEQEDGLHYSLVSKFPIPDSNGKTILIGGTAFDITERRQAEEALRESGKRFAEVVNSAMDAIISVDSNQRVVLFNPAAEKMFGCTASQVIGQPLERFIPNRHRELHKEHIFRFGQTGETGRAMGHLNFLSALRQDGTEFPIEASISYIETGGQHLYTVILRDVTERKQAEEALLESQMELQILNDTLEQKVQAQTAEIRQLASDLTRAEQRERSRVARILHDDLQQRLYAIQIQIASLSDRYAKEQQQEQKDFERIRKQLQEAVLLTRHLSIDLSPPILHDEGLTQAVEWLASQMKKQYGLQVELQAAESFATADEDLRVLVFNCIRELLFNIFKHAGENQAQVVLQRVQSDLRIEVRDNGKGFDVAGLPWQNLNLSEEDTPRLQSFGLPTIYHQLSLFSGKMEIQSEPGKGTVVTITIPYT